MRDETMLRISVADLRVSGLFRFKKIAKSQNEASSERTWMEEHGSSL